MGKILFYVDAENVSKSQVELFMAEALRLRGESDEIIGKFYGAHSALNSLIYYYLNLGLEYVETDVLADRKKNLADMKMVVDCLYDVLKTYSDDTKAVFILSNDCDFNPLVYKIRILNIPVTFSALDSFSSISSTNELSHYLMVRGFSPVRKETATVILYDYIVDMISDISLDKGIVLAYLRNKIERLLRETCTKYNIEYEDFDDSLVMIYSFWEYNRWVKSRGCIDEVQNLCFYTQKIFGSMLTKKDTESLLAYGK